MDALQQVLENDHFLLYRLDQNKRTLIFIETDSERIRKTSFLDGRFSDFQHSKLHSVPLDFALDWHQSIAKNQHKGRYIFHVSFCGSTLLSRALESNHSITYKEPLALTNWGGDLQQQGCINNIEPTHDKQLALLLSQFKKSTGAVRYVVKPSNLINALIPKICGLPEDNRVVFLTMRPSDFLIAVLRGGSDRVQYIDRLHENFAHRSPAHDEYLERARRNSPNEMQAICRSTLLALVFQQSFFEEAIERLGPENYYCMQYEQLSGAPLSELERASKVLDLGLSDAELAKNISSCFRHHSKAQTLIYDSTEARSVNTQVLEHYGRDIELALNWFDEQRFPTAHFNPLS